MTPRERERKREGKKNQNKLTRNRQKESEGGESDKTSKIPHSNNINIRERALHGQRGRDV